MFTSPVRTPATNTKYELVEVMQSEEGGHILTIATAHDLVVNPLSPFANQPTLLLSITPKNDEPITLSSLFNNDFDKSKVVSAREILLLNPLWPSHVHGLIKYARYHQGASFDEGKVHDTVNAHLEKMGKDWLTIHFLSEDAPEPIAHPDPVFIDISESTPC